MDSGTPKRGIQWQFTNHLPSFTNLRLLLYELLRRNEHFDHLIKVEVLTFQNAVSSTSFISFPRFPVHFDAVGDVLLEPAVLMLDMFY